MFIVLMLDTTQHLNTPHATLQGRNTPVTQHYDSVSAVKMKLSLWEVQLANGDAAHFLSR